MITVRQARREDADTLLQLIDALADYEKLARPDAAARERLAADGFEREPPRFQTLLADEGGVPVGYALFFETYSSFLAQPTLYIEDIFVLPEARTRGAGSVLFKALASEALARDCGRMEWVVLDWNEVAQNFYRRRGGRHLQDWHYYRLTRDGIEDLARENGVASLKEETE